MNIQIQKSKVEGHKHKSRRNDNKFDIQLNKRLLETNFKRVFVNVNLSHNFINDARKQIESNYYLRIIE